MKKTSQIELAAKYGVNLDRKANLKNKVRLTAARPHGKAKRFDPVEIVTILSNGHQCYWDELDDMVFVSPIEALIMYERPDRLNYSARYRNKLIDAIAEIREVFQFLNH